MFRAFGAALCALALSAPAPMSLMVEAPNSTRINSGYPPVRYQGNSEAIVIWTDQAGIEARCGVAPEGYYIRACAGRIGGAPVVVMPNPCAFEGEYARIACHEKGHILGWPATHGD